MASEARAAVASTERREASHFVFCKLRNCGRCAAYLAAARKRDRRRVNLIFSTIWVGIGVWGMVRVLMLVLGKH